MKTVFILLVVCGFSALVAANCGCLECNEAKLKVLDPKKHNYGCNVKVMYKDNACECQKALPYRVEIPKPEEEKPLPSYGVDVYTLKKPVEDPKYIYNTKLVRPEEKGYETYSYPIKVQKFKSKPTHRYIFNTQVEVPPNPEKPKYRNLITKLDRIVFPRKDCAKPCHPPKSYSEEVYEEEEPSVFECAGKKKTRTVYRPVTEAPKKEESYEIVKKVHSKKFPIVHNKKVVSIHDDSYEELSKEVEVEDEKYEEDSFEFFKKHSEEDDDVKHVKPTKVQHIKKSISRTGTPGRELENSYEEADAEYKKRGFINFDKEEDSSEEETPSKYIREKVVYPHESSEESYEHEKYVKPSRFIKEKVVYPTKESFEDIFDEKFVKPTRYVKRDIAHAKKYFDSEEDVDYPKYDSYEDIFTKPTTFREETVHTKKEMFENSSEEKYIQPAKFHKKVYPTEPKKEEIIVEPKYHVVKAHGKKPISFVDEEDYVVNTKKFYNDESDESSEEAIYKHIKTPKVSKKIVIDHPEKIEKTIPGRYIECKEESYDESDYDMMTIDGCNVIRPHKESHKRPLVSEKVVVKNKKHY